MRGKVRLMGSAEVIAALGVSSAYASTLMRRDDFPAPVDTLKVGRIWLAEDVEAWIAEHRKEP